MFISSFLIPVKFHIGLRLSVIFADTVDYNMHMKIAITIVTVSVSTDKCLVSGKILGIFYASCCASSPVNPCSSRSLGSEADDIVV